METRRPTSTARAVVAGVVLALIAALLAPGFGTAAGASTHTGRDPGSDAWSQVPVNQVAEVCGLDPAMLAAASRGFSGDSFSVVRYGRLCWTGGSRSPDSRYSVYSVTKSFGATLVGMVAARSSLSDTDLVSKWLTSSEMGSINPQARVAHILGATSTSSNLAVDRKGRWAYDTTGSRELNRLVTILNRVIEREPQNFPGVRNVYEFAQREMFDVLGMDNSRWSSGSGFGTGLQSSPNDMARLGLLWLRKGAWDGRQLIEEDYLYRMLHPSFADTNPGYGYMTWLNSATLVSSITGTSPDNQCSPYTTWQQFPHAPFFETTHAYGGSPFALPQQHDIGTAFAAGLGGQYIVVHRGLDLVLTGRNVTGNGQQVLWETVRPALVELDPVYRGNVSAFCNDYRRGSYAPSLISGWGQTPSPDPDPDPTPDPDPDPAPTECVRASTRAHVSADRAVAIWGTAYARGTGESLGSHSYLNYVSIRQVEAGTNAWTRVDSC
jgi:CubicO group peptidase (beta-lactamase class C family)